MQTNPQKTRYLNDIDISTIENKKKEIGVSFEDAGKG